MLPTVEESLRGYFHGHLQWLGYEVEQTSPDFDLVLSLYRAGKLYEIIETEFLPVVHWCSEEAKALLAPYKIFR